MQEVADARVIRNRILNNFELALHPNITEEVKRRLLHIVIVGGGPTGVEFGAELHDFVREVSLPFGEFLAECTESKMTSLETTTSLMITHLGQ